MNIRELFNAPNTVSLIRLAAVPYFWWVLLGEERIALAATLIFVIGGTDWVDGYLARRFDQVTALGAFLDPLADRLMIGSALVGGLLAGVIPPIIGVPLVVREALVALGAAYVGARAGATLQVRSLGKTATLLLYGAIPSFYWAAADVVEWFFTPVAWTGAAIGLIAYWWVATDYARDIGAVLATRRDTAAG